MNDRKAASSGFRRDARLTVKLGDVADLTSVKPTPARPTRRRNRPGPAAILEAIAADAARAAQQHSAVVVAVPPAANGDPTLLFLRANGQTQLMLGVPQNVIRSPRLRGEACRRDHEAERQYEYLRVAEAQEHYEPSRAVDDGINDDTDEPDGVLSPWSR